MGKIYPNNVLLTTGVINEVLHLTMLPIINPSKGYTFPENTINMTYGVKKFMFHNIFHM